MPTVSTVVTPARYAQGLTYKDFLEQALVNRDKFEQYYKEHSIVGSGLDVFSKGRRGAAWRCEHTRYRRSLARRRIPRTSHRGAYRRSNRHQSAGVRERSESGYHGRIS